MKKEKETRKQAEGERSESARDRQTDRQRQKRERDKQTERKKIIGCERTKERPNIEALLRSPIRTYSTCHDRRVKC